MFLKFNFYQKSFDFRFSILFISRFLLALLVCYFMHIFYWIFWDATAEIDPKSIKQIHAKCQKKKTRRSSLKRNLKLILNSSGVLTLKTMIFSLQKMSLMMKRKRNLCRESNLSHQNAKKLQAWLRKENCVNFWWNSSHIFVEFSYKKNLFF